MLNDLKIDLGISEEDISQDSQLQRLLTKATNDVMRFTHQKESYCLSKLRESIIELAIVRYNLKGSEGLTNHSYSGASESFVNDIPKQIQRVLVTHRKTVWK